MPSPSSTLSPKKAIKIRPWSCRYGQFYSFLSSYLFLAPPRQPDFVDLGQRRPRRWRGPRLNKPKHYHTHPHASLKIHETINQSNKQLLCRWVQKKNLSVKITLVSFFCEVKVPSLLTRRWGISWSSSTWAFPHHWWNSPEDAIYSTLQQKFYSKFKLRIEVLPIFILCCFGT